MPPARSQPEDPGRTEVLRYGVRGVVAQPFRAALTPFEGEGFLTGKEILQNPTPFLFVYGTLMRGEKYSSVMERGTYLCAGRVEGFSLYDLGDYPGIYPDPGGQVFGEVFAFEEIDSALSRLDEFEDVPSLFRREVLKVSPAESPVEAWAYVLQEDPRGRFPPIPGGDWPAYRRSRA